MHACLISDAKIELKAFAGFASIGEDDQMTFNCKISDEETENLNIKDVLVCDICNKEIKSNYELKRHKRNIHTLLDCPECSCKVPNGKMRMHRATEHGVGVQTCGICGYKSYRSYIIDVHQRRVHMKEQNVPCPQCDKKFFDSASLKNHLARHNPVKQFECQFCSKMFLRRRDLQRHEMIHTGDKRKVCNVCGERFVQKASLSYHMIKRHPDAV